MSKLLITGKNKLSGELVIGGAKNSTLPLLAATFVCKGVNVLHNCPALSDVDASLRILEGLGCKCTREGSTVTVDSTDMTGHTIPENLMREMRSSIVFLGAIVARAKAANLCTPGGCELGPRPIDLHLMALRMMGLEIIEDHGKLDCKVHKRMNGVRINLSIPSVGATENVMIAAAVATGTTIVENAAREPEISDLANFLNKAGAKIKIESDGKVVIEGVEKLSAVEYTVMPDRITAATFMAAAAVTGSELVLRNIETTHLAPVLDSFISAGCCLKIEGKNLKITAPQRLGRIPTIRTMAYPGFPTDAGPPIIAMATLCSGTLLFVENIFENRFKYVDELCRLGAKIGVEGKVAFIDGVEGLSGASVRSTDLRGGAALVVAALAAEGETLVDDIFHIDRGYEKIEDCLFQVGASIKRID